MKKQKKGFLVFLLSYSIMLKRSLFLLFVFCFCRDFSAQNVYLVNSTNDVDDGVCDATHCSLREAINAANATPLLDSIFFDLVANAQYVIQPASDLPFLNDNSGVYIDGFRSNLTKGSPAPSPNTIPIQNTNTVTPIDAVYFAVIDGQSCPTAGLVIRSNNNILRGLNVINYQGTGAQISIRGNNNLVIGCFVGIKDDGVTTGGGANHGILVEGTSNRIGDGTIPGVNIITGNDSSGICFRGGDNNLVAGNIIGMPKDGGLLVSHLQKIGIKKEAQTNGNTIGGFNPDDMNLISGNADYGIYMDSTCGKSSYYGNCIGPQSGGLNAISGSTQSEGIHISNNVTSANVGSATPGSMNIISANINCGVYIGEGGNVVQGNIIGLARNGTTMLVGLKIDGNGNTVRIAEQHFGVYVNKGSSAIGGVNQGQGNVISSNDSAGIYLASNSNDVFGNIIGLDSSGSIYISPPAGCTYPAGGQLFGIRIPNTQGNNIGNGTRAGRNVISGHMGYMNDPGGYGFGPYPGYGIYITGALATGNKIKGNCIGLARDGINTIGSQVAGIYIDTDANNNIIGGANPGDGNVISGNAAGSGCFHCPCGYIGGLFINGNNNKVYGNFIGTEEDGHTQIGYNIQDIGIALLGNNNIIGGKNPGERNIISGNGNVAYANGGIGMILAICGTGCTGNVVKGNYIGLGSDGKAFITNSKQDYGIFTLGTIYNHIGGGVAGEGNLISGNAIGGIGFNGSANIIVQGNIIGPQKDGITYVAGNKQKYGLKWHTQAMNSLIGGKWGTGEGNIISANEDYGIYLHAAATGNKIYGNYIGAGSNGAPIISSSQNYGIYIDSVAGSTSVYAYPHDNFIGNFSGALGANPYGNIISHNTQDGIFMQGTKAHENLISRNLIYSNGNPTYKAINLNATGNINKQPPFISSHSFTQVNGAGVAGDSIEVFKNGTQDCQDAFAYLGTTVVTAGGTWTLTGVSISTGEIVLATARDAKNNTSELACLIPPTFSLSITKTDVQCNGANTGAASVNVNGGLPPYSYQWSNGSTLSQISNLISQIYSVTVTDAISNIVSATVVITQPAALTLTLTGTSAGCAGSANGTATANVSGGTSPYYYSWNNGATTISIYNLTFNIYNFTVTDANNCSVISVITITASPLPVLSISSGVSICSGNSVMISAGGAVSYLWNPSIGLNSTTSAVIIASPTATTNYTVTASNGNCSSYAVVSITVNALPTVDAGPYMDILSDTTITPLVSGGTPAYSYQWDTGETDSHISHLISHIYYVTVTDANGCTATDSVTVSVKIMCEEFYLPSAFSPDADASNDVFCLYGTNCVQSLTFIIYDRWGEKVFYSHDPADCWNGSLKKDAMDTEVFYYVLDIVFLNGEVLNKKGTISLVR